MYDVAIIGGGPAGISAAIYAARYRLKTLIISPDIGGWSAKAHIIQNLPSHVSIIGKDLKEKYIKQIQANNIDYKKEKIIEILKNQDNFIIESNIQKYNAKFVIYAAGTRKRKLGIPGEDSFLGKGVCLCATCDAPLFKDKTVAVIGGNDSGTTSALLISEYAKKIYLIEIMNKLPTEPIWLEKINNDPKIEVLTSTSVKEIKGQSLVNSVVLDSEKELEINGVFIEVGSIPNTEITKKLNIKTDKWGHIEVDRSQMSSIEDFYAAGDITNNSNYMRQIVAAQSEGAVASQAIYKKIIKK